MRRQIIAELLRARRPDLANAMAHVALGGAKLDKATRQKANRDLDKAGLDGNGRFRKIGEALNVIARVLDRHGIQQDEVFSANLFREPKGHRTFHVAFGNPNDPFGPTEIENSLLVIQWFEHRPGVVEVLAYLS